MKNFVLACLCPFALMALPSGISIEQGQALSSIKGQKLTIENAPGSVLHWQQFDISKQEMVHFAQANAKSAVLNRVTGENASQLLGTLTSNGTVFLINPNGVYVGSNAQIQTAGFLASTADLSNESFASGDHLHFANLGPGAIVNDGHIACPQGDVFLIAKNVSNHGNIFAEHAGLLSAQEVIISPRGEKVFVRLKMENGTIENTGSIQALTVDLQTTSAHQKAIRHTGKIEANSIKQENGRVFLVAKEGDVTVDGQINAPAATVHVLAKNIDLQDQTQIDASSALGGTILVGGDYRGENPDIFNADTLNVAEGATIKADGYESDGGKIILWGNKRNHCLGHLSAQAFGETGNGGFIEISSPGDWYFKLGRANVLSKNGQVGTKLFDPVNITINAVGPTAPALGAGPTTYTPAANAVILDSDLATSLTTGNVTLNTSGGATGVGSVSFSGATVSWAQATTLTINADRNIIVNSSSSVINTGSGSIVFNANTAGTATGDFRGVEIEGLVQTTSGDITMTAIGGTVFAAPRNHGIAVFGPNGTITTGTGNITLDGTTQRSGSLANGVCINEDSLAAGGVVSSTGVGIGLGTISITGLANTTLGSSNGVFLANFGSITTVDAPIVVTGTFQQDLPTTFVISSDGINLETNSSIASTGTGTITLNGDTILGSASTSCHGVALDDFASVTSAAGAIEIIGTATGSASNAGGVTIDFSASILSTTSAPISITGTSTATGNLTRGIDLVAGGMIESQGTGMITLNGIGSSLGTTSTEGFYNDGSLVTSNQGNIVITGQGGGNGAGTTAQGISLVFGADVTSTGGAAIIMDGTGGDGTSGTQGVFISSTGSNITSNAGLIDVMGVGGGSGTTADGVTIVSNSTISGTGSASITLNGTASATGTTNNNGVFISGTNASVNTASGDINLTGLGDGTGNNVGIQISSAADVTSVSGAIVMNGTGGAAGTGGNGISVNGLFTEVREESGSISLIGTGQGSGTDNQGIVIGSDALVFSLGTATIGLTGTGSAAGSSDNEGILITNAGTTVSSISGQVTLIGTPGGGTDPGIHITDEGYVTSFLSAPVALNTPSGDVLIEELGNVDLQSSGSITSNIARDLNVLGSAAGATPAYINLTSGAANLTVGRDVNVVGGTGLNSAAQIGNQTGEGTVSADITINAGRDVNVTSQASYSAIGHGVSSVVQNLSGNIDISAGQDINVTAGSQRSQIGHVNSSAGGDTLGGDVTLNARNNINLTGGTAASGYARTGPGGQAGAATYNLSEVLLIAGVDIIMVANTGEAQIVNESGPLTIVTDDLFPVSPGIGPGGFSISANSVVSASP